MTDKQSLRACLLCSIVLPERQFLEEGCPNCQEIFEAANASYEEFTSGMYEGLIAQIEPKTSWVSKWQRCSNFLPGLYAVNVKGQLSEEIISELGRRRIQYRPRDGTAQEE